MTKMRLNSQVRQFGGFEQGKRVLGRTPKIPIGATGNPHFEDFTNPKDSRAAKTHELIGAIRKIRQASLNADFSDKLNSKLHMGFRDTKSGEFFFTPSSFLF